MHAHRESPRASEPFHVVQLYGSDEGALADSVARYLRDGHQAGDALLVVATPSHTAAFCGELSRLGIATPALERAGMLHFVDAESLLAQFMVDGYPDWPRFDAAVGDLVRDLQAKAGGLRAYGEMVGLLWKAGHFPSAIRLEQLWNRLRTSVAFDLYCAYPIDVSDPGAKLGLVDSLLCPHSGVVAGHEEPLDRAIARIAQRRGWGPLPKAAGGIGLYSAI